ncbi:hypothetical protein TVAG_213210 [Trichomonas vaginalis G3]|uniref:Transmembrane protein n=1 Tax=Trichomonas vaginalis (strain ATCC PRA-98 / G3) TaxID=412133 RepID=A2EEU6_TRIV3|nr:hypothetical protein TVAGG3_0061330 [Trichomonas vaginalis G3]EAY08812.1 hypothetical protein TVAG_213210 [Trichomonas vaginalis G3]KAI5542032.1 hypothetical protein TVAGG3_0061330 [Trichomonas vaginalis G3]|eukprot:XP_001321035.1 hypothetical protein [Trichomonas vaginalis G3]
MLSFFAFFSSAETLKVGHHSFSFDPDTVYTYPAGDYRYTIIYNIQGSPIILADQTSNDNLTVVSKLSYDYYLYKYLKNMTAVVYVNFNQINLEETYQEVEKGKVFICLSYGSMKASFLKTGDGVYATTGQDLTIFQYQVENNKVMDFPGVSCFAIINNGDGAKATLYSYSFTNYTLDHLSPANQSALKNVTKVSYTPTSKFVCCPGYYSQDVGNLNPTSNLQNVSLENNRNIVFPKTLNALIIKVSGKDAITFKGGETTKAFFLSDKPISMDFKVKANGYNITYKFNRGADESGDQDVPTDFMYTATDNCILVSIKTESGTVETANDPTGLISFNEENVTGKGFSATDVPPSAPFKKVTKNFTFLSQGCQQIENTQLLYDLSHFAVLYENETNEYKFNLTGNVSSGYVCVSKVIKEKLLVVQGNQKQQFIKRTDNTSQMGVIFISNTGCEVEFYDGTLNRAGPVGIVSYAADDNTFSTAQSSGAGIYKMQNIKFLEIDYDGKQIGDIPIGIINANGTSPQPTPNPGTSLQAIQNFFYLRYGDNNITNSGNFIHYFPELTDIRDSYAIVFSNEVQIANKNVDFKAKFTKLDTNLKEFTLTLVTISGVKDVAFLQNKKDSLFVINSTTVQPGKYGCIFASDVNYSYDLSIGSGTKLSVYKFDGTVEGEYSEPQLFQSRKVLAVVFNVSEDSKPSTIGIYSKEASNGKSYTSSISNSKFLSDLQGQWSVTTKDFPKQLSTGSYFFELSSEQRFIVSAQSDVFFVPRDIKMSHSCTLVYSKENSERELGYEIFSQKIYGVHFKESSNFILKSETAITIYIYKSSNSNANIVFNAGQTPEITAPEDKNAPFNAYYAFTNHSYIVANIEGSGKSPMNMDGKTAIPVSSSPIAFQFQSGESFQKIKASLKTENNFQEDKFEIKSGGANNFTDYESKRNDAKIKIGGSPISGGIIALIVILIIIFIAIDIGIVFLVIWCKAHEEHPEFKIEEEDFIEEDGDYVEGEEAPEGGAEGEEAQKLAAEQDEAPEP